MPADCAECLNQMAQCKCELLIRIACANCQYAQELLAGQNIPPSGRNPVLALLPRCPICGKWCWSRHALTLHRENHDATLN
jgi:hypothetical protein